MAALDTTVKHGRDFATARANFEEAVTAASTKYGQFIREVEWSEDRTEARLTGPGFDVLLRVDPEVVRATGTVPFFVRMLEGPVMKFIEETLRRPKG